MGIFNSYDKLQGGNSELQTINISGMWWSGNIKLDQPSPYTFWVKKQPSLFSSKAWHLNDTLSHSWIMDGYSSYSQKNDNHRFWYPSSYNHKHGQLPNPKRFLIETAMEVTEVAFFAQWLEPAGPHENSCLCRSLYRYVHKYVMYNIYI